MIIILLTQLKYLNSILLIILNLFRFQDHALNFKTYRKARQTRSSMNSQYVDRHLQLLLKTYPHQDHQKPSQKQSALHQQLYQDHRDVRCSMKMKLIEILCIGMCKNRYHSIRKKTALNQIHLPI